MNSTNYILVVDDDRDLCETVAEVLRDAGYSVVTASDGVRALEWLRTNPSPGLILLDIMMPKLDGMGFREQQLRDARLADIPVVIMTAGIPPSKPHLPPAALVRKPVSLDTLLSMVQTHVLPERATATG